MEALLPSWVASPFRRKQGRKATIPSSPSPEPPNTSPSPTSNTANMETHCAAFAAAAATSSFQSPDLSVAVASAKRPHPDVGSSAPIPISLSYKRRKLARNRSHSETFSPQDDHVVSQPEETSKHRDAAPQGKDYSPEPNHSNHSSHAEGSQTTAATPRGRYKDDTEYPVHKILDHRLREEDGAVELLVQWGDEWLDNEPTWELEEDLWTTCRDQVLKFWSPDGSNQRTSLLGLDPLQGPFTIAAILDKREARKKRSSRRKSTTYLVDFVGYPKPEWQPASCIPAEWIEAWDERKQEIKGGCA